jgi:tRNA (guanine9-N1)-methyltransferase
MELNNFLEGEFNFSSSYFTEKPIDEDKIARRDQTKESKLKFIDFVKKEKRKITREKRKENRKKRIEGLTKEERINNYNIRQEQLKLYEENLKKGLNSQYKIIFDLDYTNLMKTREIKSLASQIASCYNINKKINIPFCMHITSFTGEAKFELEAMGANNWLINFHEQNFPDVEDLMNSGRDIVYLSPDSPNILQEINEKSLYIIGGFVDKPVSKYRSLNKATSLSIKSARLPLEEYLSDLVNPVLNINNVVEIISKFLETNDWETTLKELIPQRMLNKK